MNTIRDIQALADRYVLGSEAGSRLARLLDALEGEPDPPTAIRGRAEALERHLADSLEGLRVPQLRSAAWIADIGAGAGFPGLPLAVALPGARVDLIESTRRKCAVIERLAAAAGAANARPVPARVEEWAAGEGAARYEAATARAVAPLAVLVEYAAPLLVVGGVLVAWKGARDAAEDRSGAEAASVVGLEPEHVGRARPFAGARDRHLHVYRKVKATPDRFPRRPGMAAKRPLA